MAAPFAGGGPFRGFDGGGVAENVPHQLVAGVGFDEVLVDLRRQRVVRKRREGAAEGGFAGNFPGAFPAAKSAQQGARRQRVQERAGGGELINALGNESVRQPGALVRRTAIATPLVTAGKTPQIGERHDFAERLVQGVQRAQFVGERGKKLALLDRLHI
jgi:hypothetical protein